ncbi:TetR/AcrR family transcriptional regulator [Pseudonocardia sp. TRM90224]|uniref:TetR/AcrR family transcriptional regulator n=1 Tax=Pseudonocardia sp. TRM90224 TaxID=2812678 RepID=UPI001E644E4B|nr:TetR/AcrR family transcriptional regulator [Pseudonocardia sp. TRM90224]
MARPKLHDEKLRRRLLERAGIIVSTEGVEQLSMRTLAAACGTSTTAVYALFGGKSGLVTALFDDAFRRLGTRLAAVAPGVDAVDHVVQMGLAYRDSAVSEPHLFTLMFAGRTGLPAASEARTAAGTALGPLREAVDRAVDERFLRADTDATTASLTLWTTVHGWVSLQLRGFLPPGSDGRLEAALRAVLDGWRPQPS